jgi:predicted DNA-binding transcriptional regulator YafY
MDTAERLLALLGLLQRRLHWSADDLADELAVTTRTVRRDVVRLRTYGYPVEAFAGHGGGYQLGRGGSLPPLLLDDDETLAVALGLGVVGAAAIAGIDEAAVSALGKIEQLLPARLRSRLEDLGAASFTSFAGSAASPVSPGDRRAFTSLARAASGRVHVGFDYIDGRGATSRRRVEPVRLVHVRRTWYLAAFDLDRDDWRTFRLDRISAVELEPGRFPLRVGPDPVELVTRSAPPSWFEYRARVEVACSPDEARQRVPEQIGQLEVGPSASGTGSTRDGAGGSTCVLVIGTDDLEWLGGYLIGLPWAFDVLEPAALRAIVRRRAAAIVATHTRRRPDDAVWVD